MPTPEIKRYWQILGIFFVIFILELFGSIVSGSLTLAMDTVHVLGDKIGTIVSLIASYAVLRNALYAKKIKIWGARTNGIILGISTIWISYEAYQRILRPEPILTGIMFWIAVIGAALNYAQHRILETAEDHEKDEVHRSQHIHILSDLWLSLAVIISSLLIKMTNQTIIDPVLSLIVAVVMSYWSWKMIFIK